MSTVLTQEEILEEGCKNIKGGWGRPGSYSGMFWHVPDLGQHQVVVSIVSSIQRVLLYFFCCWLAT